MSNLRIIELEQQLKRRDDRLQEIEVKINQLKTYDPRREGEMYYTVFGEYLLKDEVLECFK